MIMGYLKMGCGVRWIMWLMIHVVVLMVSSSEGAQTRHFKWEVEYVYWSPDCVEHAVMGINGQFPGPTLGAQAGDTIIVQLVNKLPTEGVVIHWHGIRQIGTPWADGTASISQCAINPGETFIYKFKVDKAGTYFYHGHYGMQRSAGLYGSLIVEVADGVKEPFHYDDEFNLLLSDWWHKSSHDQELELSSKPFRWVGEPQSLLINGRGQYNCSLAAQFSNSSLPECKLKGDERCAPQLLHVEPNKTYRIRLASTTSLASLNFAIGSHKMVVVEADGNYVKPYEVDSVDIYSGESYSVLINTNQDPTHNYWVRMSIIGRKPGTQPGLTILHYKTTSDSKLPTSPPPNAPAWNDFDRSKAFTYNIFSIEGSPEPPKDVHRQIGLLNTQNSINGFTKWAINNVSLVLPTTPYLGSMKYGLNHTFNQNSPPDNFPNNYDVTKPPVNPNSTVGNGVYMFEMNKTIDVILQNTCTLTENVSEVHPWHLHGHDFWILGYGDGKFTTGNAKKFNLKNPPFRNTAVIFPYGWAALRFVTDNPGVWAFHCHIEPHLHMGMGVVFAEGVHMVKNIPNEALICGETGMMSANKNNNHNK